VKIELLYFDGCPNHELLLPRLRDLLDHAGLDEEIHLRRVESLEAAESERFLGSPTLRIDGRDVDPGAAERSDFGLKCRLYRSDAGLTGVPAEQWILDAVGAVGNGTGTQATELAVANLSRAWAPQRLARLSPAQRRVHQRILRGFVDAGRVTEAQLTAWAREERLDPEETCGALAASDLVHLDPTSGAVGVAYPFSGSPTPHRVRLAGGSEVYAMCALDALGIAFMLDAPIEIVSKDPKTGEQIEVSVAPHGGSAWSPGDASVVVGCELADTSAACMCPQTHFTASTDRGHALLEEMDGSAALLSMPEAIETGRELFGNLLDGETGGEPWRRASSFQNCSD
jgi:hypothetical protein